MLALLLLLLTVTTTQQITSHSWIAEAGRLAATYTRCGAHDKPFTVNGCRLMDGAIL
jgi:hypothetical protein